MMVAIAHNWEYVLYCQYIRVSIKDLKKWELEEKLIKEII